MGGFDGEKGTFGAGVGVGVGVGVGALFDGVASAMGLIGFGWVGLG